MQLYIGNLAYATTEEDLRDLFTSAGFEIQEKDVVIIKDKLTGRSKGFGFVEMSDAEAQAAISKLNNAQLGGRSIAVNAARPRTEGGNNGYDRPRNNNNNFRSKPRSYENH
ncbi:MAG: RNA-binding protein [Chlamydiales bacterium]|jgi:RNA recognition motif-containing protein|nr:RNA-binding protein [Chlamydiales bacterium]